MPLSRAGIIAGAMLVFIPCVGEYVIPELLGGPQTQMIGRTLWDEFFSNNDWPMACAVAVTMVLLVIVPLAVFSRYQAESAGAARLTHDARHRRLQPQRSRAAGWRSASPFLYVPIVALVVYSFNDSPVANVWRGFTLKWYAALADDRELLAGLWLSLKVAFATACASVVLGTLAAFALVRYRRFFGRTLFAGMVAAPLVMPEVIIGLSLLLMLVSLQRATEAASASASPSAAC